MQSTNGNQLWCPGQSLWSLIAEHAPESELPKIHTALGRSLVDMYTEVHAEAAMWYKMWQESQQCGTYRSRAGTPLPNRRGPLADPPVVKELVRAEVRMLLQNLKERAVREGRHEDQFLFHYKPETVDFALERLCSLEHGDNDTESRPSSQCSVLSNVEDEIEALKDKLNVTDIDQVVDRIKSLLIEECEALKRQVKTIQGNIKKECRSQCDFIKVEPSLAELKELRGAIRTDLELFPSSPPLPFSALPVKESKNRLRLSAGRRIPEKTLPALTTIPVQRPRPPSSPCPVKPPPRGPKTTLLRTHDQHRSKTASTGPSKTQAATCNRIIMSRHRNIHLTTSASDMMMDEPSHQCIGFPEQDSAALYHRTPTCSSSFQITTERSSPEQLAHPSFDQKNLRKDVNQQQYRSSHCLTTHPSHYPAYRGTNEEASYTQPKRIHIYGQLFASHKRPLGGITSHTKSAQEAQTEKEYISSFLQPVPPARVSS